MANISIPHSYNNIEVCDAELFCSLSLWNQKLVSVHAHPIHQSCFQQTGRWHVNIVCAKLAHSSLVGGEDILTTHFIIITKSDVFTFPLLSYFFVVVCLKWLCHHILTVSYISRESWILCLLLLCSLMMCANKRIHYDSMVVFVCLHITLPH